MPRQSEWDTHIPATTSPATIGTSTVLQFGFRNDSGNFDLDDIGAIRLTILSVPHMTIGQTNFTFLLSGPSGKYVVQTSSNLTNWTSITTSTVPVSGSITLTNGVNGSSRHFYRTHHE